MNMDIEGFRKKNGRLPQEGDQVYIINGGSSNTRTLATIKSVSKTGRNVIVVRKFSDPEVQDDSYEFINGREKGSSNYYGRTLDYDVEGNRHYMEQKAIRQSAQRRLDEVLCSTDRIGHGLGKSYMKTRIEQAQKELESVLALLEKMDG